MDVTKDKDVEDAAKIVEKWLVDGDKSKRRCLHALVNNAGIGIAGLSDWLKVSDFQAIMDVNFFGTIRCVKAFSPILKQQVSTRTYTDARVVNMVSSAGFIAGGIFSAAYESSKHAVDAYTTNLRLELSSFGIKVTALNPGMHKTPLAEGKAIAKGMKKVWDALSPEHRKEYGEGMYHFMYELSRLFRQFAPIVSNMFLFSLPLLKSTSILWLGYSKTVQESFRGTKSMSSKPWMKL